MEKPAKTNPLAMASFVYGLVLTGFWVLKPVFSPLFDTLEDSAVMAVLTIVGPLIGVFALIQMKKRNEVGQGQIFAWFGILLAFISPLCQLLFLMTTSWSGY
jgi:hypothetical protein